MSRLLVASNRLPVTVHLVDGGFELVPSVGGLATALKVPHESGDGIWFGWPGDISSQRPESHAAIAEKLAEMRLRPVQLSASEVERYYDGFSNGVLWPLFHYALDKVRLDADEDFKCYQAVNQRFAEALAAEIRPGDRVWIHDYQLCLVPEYLRRLCPYAKIGFFLHVPFPAADVFRMIPWREEILRGLLGADLLGFHTITHRTNFNRACAHVLGLDLEVTDVPWADRTVHLGAYPISIDSERFAQQSPEIDAEIATMRDATGGKKLILGIDRLDYTKGILRRLAAYERLLTHDPDLASRVHFLQIGVPSRESVDAYSDLRKQVNELVGRINARFGTPASAPVHFLYRSIPFNQMVGLYRAADVMLVTPLRDGMNLVAKEYCAARTDDLGVLVLSEFAGAADELREALIVNPHDIAAIERTLGAALSMPEAEQRLRMSRLRAHVKRNGIELWNDRFLTALDLAAESHNKNPIESSTSLDREMERLKAAPALLIILDYDGTLVPLAFMPELAYADKEVKALVDALSARQGTHVHVVTGRAPASIESFLGESNVGLHAEHGYWTRPERGKQWLVRVDGTLAWKETLGPMLREVAAKMPGTLVEEKTSAIALHYRGADPALASERMRELRGRLYADPHPEIEILEGSKVLELRLKGVNKGLIARTLTAELPTGTLVFAAGDDRTDEDLFAALPPEAVTVHVGAGRSRARFRIPSPAALRALIGRLVPKDPK